MKIMLAAVLTILLGYLAIVMFFAFSQNRFIYFPSRHMIATEDVGLENIREIRLVTSDGLHLAGWYLPPPKDAPVLINFNGNAGNISSRLHLMAMAQQNGWGMVLFDYRGYGLSEGTPTEAGLYLDSRAVYQWLPTRGEIDLHKIIYYAQSLGCAVALELAAQHPPAGIILEAPFTRLRDLAAHHYPWLPISILLQSRFDNLEQIRKIHCPVLIVHGSQDEIIPFRHGRALYEAAPGPKQFMEVKAHHNDIFEIGGRKYSEAMKDFVANAIPR